MKNNLEVELLAPAKDKNCAFAAINCGADAVYIGAEAFGARKNAGNSIVDIKEIIDYAHKFNVKVYVTINTALYDNELASAKKLVEKLYQIGTDALIVQDFGLLELDLPPIPLHASTQCHNATLEKVKFLENIGFERAVLARELSINEIKTISNNTSIELECFIHGALCVSYSGQCYMSYAIGGRSANRGECAQACRKKYSLIDKNNRKITENSHLLCLKDFNATEYLEEMIDAGVTSFKIEGRLKDENYVKNVVGFYRKKLDEILSGKKQKKSSEGEIFTDFNFDINKSFNRGYCSYFLGGRNNNITSFDTPKNRGEYIGKITEISQHSFKLDKNILNVGDGITFFTQTSGTKELCGTKTDKIINGNIFPNSMKGLKKGLEIYRNFDCKYLKSLETAKIERKIPVQINVDIGSNLIFTISDGKNFHSIEVKNDFEPAQNKLKAKENLEKQLSKLGNTEFIANSVFLKGQNPPFIKINEINEIRRKLIEEFQEIRKRNYKIKKQLPIIYQELENKILDYKYNILNKKAKEFYENCGCKISEPALEHPSHKNFNGKQVMETKHCLKYSLGFCSKQKQAKNLAEPLFLVDEKGQKYELEFDCKNCHMKIFFGQKK